MPLSAHFRWIEWEPGYLTIDYNFGCVGSVRQQDGYVDTRVQWQQHVHFGRAASMRQGKRFVERWLATRKGFPGYVRRNPIKGWKSSGSLYARSNT